MLYLVLQLLKGYFTQSWITFVVCEMKFLHLRFRARWWISLEHLFALS